MGMCAPDMGGDDGCETDEDCGEGEVCDMGFCMPDMGW